MRSLTATFLLPLAAALAICPPPNLLIAQESQVHQHSADGSSSTSPTQSALTLQTLESWALDRNPTLIQSAAQVEMSQGKAIQAGLYPNPTVGYTAEQIGAAGTAGELHGLFVQQEVVRGRKLQLSRDKYLQEETEARIRHEAQQCRVVASVRKAFYQALATQRQVRIRQQLLSNAEDALKTTRDLLNVGQANKADVLQAEVQVSRIKATVRASQRRYLGHWRELAAYVGIPDMAPSLLDGQLEIAENEVLEEGTTLANLLACSPDIRAAWTEIARDRVGLEREIAEPIPNLQLRAESGYNYETNNTVAGVSIGLRLPVWDKNQGTIQQARAELSRAEADVNRIELNLRRRFGETFSEYEAALAEAKSYEEEVLPKAKEAYESYLNSFQNRRAAWPQVLVAQREYFQLSEEYISRLLEVRHAEAEINSYFLGDGLDQPIAPVPQGHREATPRPR